MIQLTEICYDLDGNPYERIINVPDSILVKDEISNRIGGGKSIVIVPGIGKYEVKETRNEVARKVLKWRLAWECGDVEMLYQIAGLGDKHDPRLPISWLPESRQHDLGAGAGVSGASRTNQNRGAAVLQDKRECGGDCMSRLNI